MSYQQRIRMLLSDLAAKLGYPAALDVTVARPGSFDMKVSLRDPLPTQECVFDLSRGFTPRVQRSLVDWFTAAVQQSAHAGHSAAAA